MWSVYDSWGPFSLSDLTWTPACKNNHMPSNVWDVITYPLPNCNGIAVEVWDWISNYILIFMRDVIIHAGIQVNPCWLKGQLMIVFVMRYSEFL